MSSKKEHQLVRELRKHADTIAGGGPSEPNYDPFSLDLLHRVADRLQVLTEAIQKHKDTFPDEPLEGELELWKTIEQ